MKHKLNKVLKRFIKFMLLQFYLNMKLKQTLVANSIVLQLKCLIHFFMECVQDLIRLFAVFPIFPTKPKNMANNLLYKFCNLLISTACPHAFALE